MEKVDNIWKIDKKVEKGIGRKFINRWLNASLQNR